MISMILRTGWNPADVDLTCHLKSFIQQENNRVATAQGKQGIWFLLFPDRENREFCFDTGKNSETQGKYFCVTQGKYLTVNIKIKSMFISKFFSLASLDISLHFKVLSTFASTCFICYFTCVFAL